MSSRTKEFISAQFLARLLIVSYFVALSLGLTGGADMRQVSDPFLPSTVSHYAMRALVLTLCGMILFDVYRRVATLILSVIVFWSSYLAFFLGGDIGDFWLNIALIGALLHIGGFASQAEEAEHRNDEEDFAGAERRIASRTTPGGDLPYRKDLEVVRDR